MSNTKNKKIVSAYKSGKKTVSEIKYQFRVSGSTLYRLLDNAGVRDRRSGFVLRPTGTNGCF